MSKPYRKWKVTIKEVARELPIHTEMHGPYDLDDVREHFGLEAPDVEWYKIEEKKDDDKSLHLPLLRPHITT